MSQADKGVLRYEFRGASVDLFKTTHGEVLIEGPAGTSKSVSALSKVNMCMEVFPKARALLVRKTRVSLRQSMLITWEKFIQPELSGVRFNKEDGEYRYPNGSIVALGGLDKASKLMSTEWDIIFFQEATEGSEDDVQDLSTRLRNNVMPYQQLIMDANPDKETHWLNRRADTPVTLRLHSKHKDNPSLWDMKLQEWTERGFQYMARLQTLYGVRRKRLLSGIWASAEGMVYEEWDSKKHIVPPYRPKDDWPIYLAVDFGFQNPFVAQIWTVDYAGALVLVKEIYMTNKLVEDHAATIKQVFKQCGYNSPRAIICDHDAEGRATLEKHLGQETVPATKGIQSGIQAVKARLRINPSTNRPGLMIMSDSLWEQDPTLSDPEQGKSYPVSTPQEFEGYIWDTRNNVRVGEKPVDRDNHGLDTARYMVAYYDNIAGEQQYQDFMFQGVARGRVVSV